MISQADLDKALRRWKARQGALAGAGANGPTTPMPLGVEESDFEGAAAASAPVDEMDPSSSSGVITLTKVDPGDL